MPDADPLLEGLNPSQRQAALSLDGPVLILAGAGSGKTHTVTRRIAKLIATERAQPGEILAVTFTNKAAGELRERLQGLLGPAGSRVWAMTFHALCVRVLRRSGPTVGLPSAFSIADTSDQRRLTARAVQECTGGAGTQDPHAARKLHSIFSRAKNEGAFPDGVADLAQRSGLDERLAQRVADRYQALLGEAGAVDFDDLLLRTVEVLDTEQGRKQWAGRFRYVTVDEYQDTNRPQYEILRRLCAEHRNLCVIGDDDQSIYRFRGADSEHILAFERDWPGATVVKLEHNYRSSASILRAANAVIARNTRRAPKQLRPTSGDGPPVRLAACASEWDEARLVSRRIRKLDAAGVPLREIAVVVRNNHQTRVIEEILTGDAVAYHVVGGVEFYRRAEVQAARAYLRLVDNPRDHIALERAVAWPKRGIGEQTLAALNQAAQRAGVPAVALAAAGGPIDGVKPAQRRSLHAFASIVKQARQRLDTVPASRTFAWLLDACGLLSKLREDGEEGQQRAGNVAELLGVARRFDHLPGREGVQAFLEQTALVEGSAAGQDGRVSLMTCHATKGLEFDVVFLCGLEDAMFLRADHDRSDVEEERRLLYVGITRARKELWLTHAQRKRMFGGEPQRMAPLRFLADLPDDVQRVHAKPAASSRPAPAGRPRTGPPPKTAPRRQVTRSRPASPRPAAAAPPPRARVTHAKFGPGTVTAVADGRATVAFDRAGVRTITTGHLRPLR